MLPLIYTNAEATALFLAACLVWIVPEMGGTIRQTARITRKEASVQDRGSMGILIGLQWSGLTLNFALAALFPAAAMRWQRATLFSLGIAFILLGVALRWYAIWTLGRYFTRDVAVSIGQQIVQNGPYRALRHPAYSGTFLTMLGVGLAMTNWASLPVLFTGVLVGHLYRVHVEEKALVETIGQPYIEYMRRTKRFIPMIF
ncbi:MAG TPA: isoprenylcysteine carboxylmethyltransferase family protein [Ktedonobacteraceae bacterium]|nr:isoprenylcysteine carboxylmethyltransferase family protein [Ktedonobacteraceae bacterium]